MPDYQNGKIYKITSGDLTYIGSTCQSTLARRLSEHVSDYKRWKAGGKKGRTTSLPLIETGQYEITLIELYPCVSRDELRARERFHIESNVCVNKNIPGRTFKEYYDKHREELLEKQKDYYATNRSQILEHAKDYRETHKEQISSHMKDYYIANRSHISEKNKNYNAEHKEHLSKYRKDYYIAKKKAKTQPSDKS